MTFDASQSNDFELNITVNRQSAAESVEYLQAIRAELRELAREASVGSLPDSMAKVARQLNASADEAEQLNIRVKELARTIQQAASGKGGLALAIGADPVQIFNAIKVAEDGIRSLAKLRSELESNLNVVARVSSKPGETQSMGDIENLAAATQKIKELDGLFNEIRSTQTDTLGVQSKFISENVVNEKAAADAAIARYQIQKGNLDQIIQLTKELTAQDLAHQKETEAAERYRSELAKADQKEIAAAEAAAAAAALQRYQVDKVNLEQIDLLQKNIAQAEIVRINALIALDRERRSEAIAFFETAARQSQEGGFRVANADGAPGGEYVGSEIDNRNQQQKELFLKEEEGLRDQMVTKINAQLVAQQQLSEFEIVQEQRRQRDAQAEIARITAEVNAKIAENERAAKEGVISPDGQVTKGTADIQQDKLAIDALTQAYGGPQAKLEALIQLQRELNELTLSQGLGVSSVNEQLSAEIAQQQKVVDAQAQSSQGGSGGGGLYSTRPTYARLAFLPIAQLATRFGATDAANTIFGATDVLAATESFAIINQNVIKLSGRLKDLGGVFSLLSNVGSSLLGFLGPTAAAFGSVLAVVAPLGIALILLVKAFSDAQAAAAARTKAIEDYAAGRLSVDELVAGGATTQDLKDRRDSTKSSLDIVNADIAKLQSAKDSLAGYSDPSYSYENTPEVRTKTDALAASKYKGQILGTEHALDDVLAQSIADTYAKLKEQFPGINLSNPAEIETAMNKLKEAADKSSEELTQFNVGIADGRASLNDYKASLIKSTEYNLTHGYNIAGEVVSIDPFTGQPASPAEVEAHKQEYEELLKSGTREGVLTKARGESSSIVTGQADVDRLAALNAIDPKQYGQALNDAKEALAQHVRQLEFYRGILDEISRADEERKIADDLKKAQDDLSSASKEYADSLKTLKDGLKDKLDGLLKSFNEGEDKDKIANDRAKEDALQNLNDSLADIDTNAAQKREDINAKAAKDEADALEKHKKKLQEIDDKFAEKAEDAIANRDAVALYKAMRDRDDAKKTENDDYATKKKEDEQKRKDELAALDKDVARQKLAKQTDYDRQLRDLQRSFDQQRADKLAAYKLAQDDARANYVKEYNLLTDKYLEQRLALTAHLNQLYAMQAYYYKLTKDQLVAAFTGTQLPTYSFMTPQQMIDAGLLPPNALTGGAKRAPTNPLDANGNPVNFFPVRDYGGSVLSGHSYLIGKNRRPEVFTPTLPGMVHTLEQFDRHSHQRELSLSMPINGVGLNKSQIIQTVNTHLSELLDEAGVE